VYKGDSVFWFILISIYSSVVGASTFRGYFWWFVTSLHGSRWM